MTSAKRLMFIAVGFGFALGLGAAVSIPRHSGSAAAASPAVPAGARSATNPFVALPGTVKMGAPFPSPTQRNGVYLKVRPGTLHTEIREKDPAGGADWVMRRYVADRIEPVSTRRPRSDGRIGSGPCMQIGREVRGQFGWIDGSNTFHPVSTRSRSDVPGRCFSSKIAVTHQPQVGEITLLGNPRGADPYVRGSIAWGIVATPVRSVSIKAAGQIKTPTLSPSIGAFLQFYGPDRSAADLELRVRYATGSEKSVGLSPALPSGFAPLQTISHGVSAVDTTTAMVAARAPDPAGGPSWGVLAARTAGGSWCTFNSGYVVGNRVGNIDPQLGELIEEDRHRMGCAKPDFAKYGPIALGSSFGAEPGQNQLQPARGKLRLQSGRSTFYGLVDPNADLVTITSPRDVRSVVPAGPAHAIIVVYDGVLSGTVTFTVHMRNGTTRTMHENAGF